jgi:hypothetical protein
MDLQQTDCRDDTADTAADAVVTVGMPVTTTMTVVLATAVPESMDGTSGIAASVEIVATDSCLASGILSPDDAHGPV